MSIEKNITTVLLILTTFTAWAQDKVAVKVFTEVPAIAKAIAATNEADSVLQMYHYFEEAYPVARFYQLNSLLDQVREITAERLIAFGQPSALKPAVTIESHLIRWKLLEKIKQEGLLAGLAVDSVRLSLLALGENIPSKQKIVRWQCADLMFFVYGAERTREYLDKENIGEADWHEHPMLAAHLWASQDNHAQAVQVLSEWVRSGRADEYVKDKLARFYRELPNRISSYEAYEANLMNDIRQRKSDIVDQYAVDYPAPTFELISLSGQKVALQDMKGKIILLDFWATWCRPCVAAFPAMQKIVERYENNPDVLILFVNTFEREKDKAERIAHVQSFVKQKNLPFEVVLDTSYDVGYITAAAYDVDAIPAQFVINKTGQVRYRLKGFDGATDSYIEEISYLLDKLSAEII
jgi:thiol-disulfide isomerase/thioredoxin